MNRSNIIEPRILKGFRDFNSKEQTLRQWCVHTLQRTYAQLGYVPIDTPILEYADILLGKSGGETEKQIYAFEDQGARKVAMRFDLTVPFARYVAMNYRELPNPFFRYQIGRVFRGENTQRGRYREFMQCDFDIIGEDSLSLDFTIVHTILQSFAALGLVNVKVHVSHRAILADFLCTKKCKDTVSHDLQKNIVAETLRIIDKVRKIGEDKTRAALEQLWENEVVDVLMALLQPGHTNDDTLSTICTHIDSGTESVQRLKDIVAIVKTLGLEERVVVDPSIIRGLDYYTGFVCETFVQGFEDLGSVCSGGRYDSLTALFCDEKISGVGASIGLDRLLAIIGDEQISVPKKDAVRTLVIMPMEHSCVPYCHGLVDALRSDVLSVHVYPRLDTMKSFFKYTEKIGADYVCIVGSEELASRTVTIKNQHTRDQLQKVSIETAVLWTHNEN